MNALTPLAVQNADVLRTLADLGETTIAALALALNKDTANLRKTLLRLESDGVVSMKPLGLTGEGRAVVAAIDGEPADANAVRAAEPRAAGVAELLHAQIYPDPHNPRTDWDSAEAQEDLESLAASIAQDGLLQNLVVRPMPADDLQALALAAPGGASLYRLVAGERRWRSIGLLIARGDWPADRPIAAAIRDMDDATHRRLALIENLKRRDLKPLEEARAFKQLVDGGLKTADLATAINCTQRMVQQRIQLLELDEKDQARLDAGQINLEEARRRVANKPQPLELTPIQWLALAELTLKTAREKPARHWWTATEVGPDAREAVKSMGLLGAVDVSGPDYRDGRIKASLSYAVGEEFAKAHPAFATTSTVTAMEAAIIDLRANAEGDLAAGDYAASGYYAMPWLNGPFDLTPEGADIVAQRTRETAERDKAEADRVAAEEARRQSAAAYEEKGRRFLAAVREFEELSGGMDGATFASSFRELLQAYGATAPWLLAVGEDGEQHLVDAEDRPNVGQGDTLEARRRIIAIAVNHAAGLAAYSGPPLEKPEPSTQGPGLDDEEIDLGREAFLAAMAEGLTDEDLTLSPEVATALAEAHLATFLAEDRIEFGDPGYEWTFTAAKRLALEMSEDA